MNQVRYTPEIKAFIREHSREMSIPDMVRTVNEKFGTDFTLYAFRSYYERYDIHPSPRAGRKRGSKYPDDLEEYIRSIAAGREKSEILSLVNEHYGHIMELYQLKAYMNNHSITSGLNCNFRKGHTPWNKYTNYIAGGRSAETRFKKSGLPPTWRPVGSVRINCYGFTEIKVAEPNTWKLKHRLIWEAEHGPIPKGCIITFKDGNRQNFDIDNLACITQAQNAVINKLGLWGSGENFDAVMKLVDLKMMTTKKRKERKGK